MILQKFDLDSGKWISEVSNLELMRVRVITAQGVFEIVDDMGETQIRTPDGRLSIDPLFSNQIRISSS